MKLIKKLTKVKDRLPEGVYMKLRTAGGPHCTKKGERGYKRQRDRKVDDNS